MPASSARCRFSPPETVTRPERQRTLRATIEWSYELLNLEERRLFERLAVFAGSFELEAAEHVCSAGLDTLQSLVDKSLVRRWGSGRLGLLETIHELAGERLETSGESEAVERRHAEYFLALAESANLAAEAEGPQRHEIVIRDQDNLHAALGRTVESGDRVTGLRLAIALENFWVTNDGLGGTGWFDALLHETSDVPRELLARAFRASGSASDAIGQHERAERSYERSLAEYRALEDERGVAIALHRLSVSAFRRGNMQRCRSLADRSLAIHERIGFVKGELQVLGTLGSLERKGGHPERALPLLGRSAALAAEVGFHWWQAGTLLNWRSAHWSSVGHLKRRRGRGSRS